MRAFWFAAAVAIITGGFFLTLDFITANSTPFDKQINWLLNDVLGASWWDV